MNLNIKSVTLISLPLVLIPLIAIGWRQPGSDAPQDPKPPTLHKLEFTGPEEPWPPLPKGRTNVKEVISTEIPGSLTDALEERIRSAAVQSANVRQLLGSRFVYIGMDEIEPDKGKPRAPSDPLTTMVTFFSYSNNTAVDVQMKGESVQLANARKDYIPAEGAEELRDAIALARADARLGNKLVGLKDVNGILVEVPKGSVGYGNRVIEVFFGNVDQDLPSYHALVDLTRRTVLVAEPLLSRR
jgi:hypothetical protein